MRYLIISYGVGLVLLGLYPLRSEYGSLIQLVKKQSSWLASGEWLPDSLPSGENLGFRLGGTEAKNSKPFRLEPFKELASEGELSAEAPLVNQEPRKVSNATKKGWSFWDVGSVKDEQKRATDSMNARDRDELRALLGEVEE